MTENTIADGFASATIEVKAAHRIDEARLAAFMTAQVLGFAGPLTVKQFEGGQSNPTYFLHTPERNYVLRR
ncbi:MAG: phosphotransferase family protein, partial [Gammaproteobacteria bacterium]